MKNSNYRKVKKVTISSFFLFTLVILLAFQMGFASAPSLKTQVPGYYRKILGDFEVTALYDGYVQFGTEILTNAKPKEIQSLLKRSSLPENNLSVNGTAYLINTGTQLILVDTGAGVFWKGLGTLMDSMKAAGYAPEQVDLVLLTHLHIDHDGGLLNSEGKRAFPNADIRMAKAESDYWTSEDNQKKAPEVLKGMFTIARIASLAYQTAGRWKPFNSETELVPGVKPVPLSGHTVGHTGYEFTSKGKSLLIWGDIVHSAAVQINKPNVGVTFDSDPNMAICTRRKIFNRVVKEELMVAGAHLPYPGIGHLQKIRGLYHWLPVDYISIP